MPVNIVKMSNRLVSRVGRYKITKINSILVTKVRNILETKSEVIWVRVIKRVRVIRVHNCSKGDLQREGNLF